jgi:hypothetical protein
MIKGRYNIYVYVTFIFVLALLTISIYLISHPYLTLKGKTGHTFPAPLIGLIFLLIAFFPSYVLAKVIYLITIDTTSISIKGVFKKRVIERSEIKLIDLFSREDFHWSAGSVTIGTRIELQNGEKFIIADPFYSNIDVIKQTLSENFKEKIKPYNINKTAGFDKNIFENDFEKFAGNLYSSLNGLLFFAIVLTLTIMILYKQNLKPGHLFIAIPVFFVYVGLGLQLNYFLVSNKRLIVKNHLLFWINKEYEIDSIIEVNFESPYRRSDALGHL